MAAKFCKICKDQKPWARLDVHLRHMHNGMTMEEYEKYDPNAEEIVEFKPKEAIKPLDLMDNIFDGKTKKTKEDLPLKEFLKEFKLTEKDLRAIVKNYIDGKPLPFEQQKELHEARGKREANALTKTNIIRTTDIYIAEALEKHFNYKCIAVHSAKGTIPKLWELEKQE